MLINRDEAERRREAAFERLGTRTPKCRYCPETDPSALTGTAPNIVCYQCQAIRAGKPPTEDHHLGGQHNHPFTVPILANDHRRLNDMQNDWPKQTLTNPDGSPMIGMAALVRGAIDVLVLIIKGILVKIPAALEDLDTRLTYYLGPAWWVTISWQGVR